MHLQALLDAVDVPFALEGFLTVSNLGLPPDREEHRAASRRQSRIDTVPAPLRPAVFGFVEHLVRDFAGPPPAEPVTVQAPPRPRSRERGRFSEVLASGVV